MKQLLFFFFFISTTTFSQNFENVDTKVLEYPRFSKVEDLTNQIEKDFSSDADKVRAAFFWLAKNIRYNLKEYYNPRKRSYSFRYSSEEEKVQKIQALIDNLVNKAFRNKMGVCEEYAQSFKKICDLLHIEAAVIQGYTRNTVNEIGVIPNASSHAWNGVKIDGKWMILDATWAAGSLRNGKWNRKFNNYFFDMPKEKMFKTHYPKDAIWVLRFGRMSLQEFYNQPIYKNTFLKLNADLISPQTGIIKLKSSENIELEFKNLDPNLLIFYTLKGVRLAQKPIIKRENNISTLTIQNPKRNTDLILYINNGDALHFKVKVK